MSDAARDSRTPIDQCRNTDQRGSITFPGTATLDQKTDDAIPTVAPCPLDLGACLTASAWAPAANARVVDPT